MRFPKYLDFIQLTSNDIEAVKKNVESCYNFNWTKKVNAQFFLPVYSYSKEKNESNGDKMKTCTFHFSMTCMMLRVGVRKLMRWMRIQLLLGKLLGMYSIRFPLLIILQFSMVPFIQNKVDNPCCKSKAIGVPSLFHETAKHLTEVAIGVTQYNMKSNDIICMLSVWHTYMMMTAKWKRKKQWHANA